MHPALQQHELEQLTDAALGAGKNTVRSTTRNFFIRFLRNSQSLDICPLLNYSLGDLRKWMSAPSAVVTIISATSTTMSRPQHVACGATNLSLALAHHRGRVVLRIDHRLDAKPDLITATIPSNV